MKTNCCALAGEICTCANHDPVDARRLQATGLAGRHFSVKRLGTIMSPLVGRDDEVEGVLNPAAARSRDGELYLFPRLVAPGNISRIGTARVVFRDGDPVTVERMGYALEPTANYESDGLHGGCEDARVVFFPPLDLYIMTYTAFGPIGPRIAVAVSPDLLTWQRRGLVRFNTLSERYCNPFGDYNNKDGVIFPSPVPDPEGRLSLALLHRPVYDDGNNAEGCYVPCGIDDHRASIWISYCPLDELDDQLCRGLSVSRHQPMASPQQDWENFRIGAGPPPVMTNSGWLLIYHGVSVASANSPDSGVPNHSACYQAGLMVLDPADPRNVIYRSASPILAPELESERAGTVPNVVFPSGLDMRNGIGSPDRIDIYYGMADARIGAATLMWGPDET